MTQRSFDQLIGLELLTCFFFREVFASLAAVLQLIIINHKSKMENDVFYIG